MHEPPPDLVESPPGADPQPLFEGKVFSWILSLGADCEPAHHLRRTGRYQAQSLFDWLVTPLGAVGAILQDDAARLATRFVATAQGATAQCAEYGVLYQHEFPRTQQEEVLFDIGAIERCRGKLSHKYAKLVATCSRREPVLFIRAWPWAAAQGGPDELTRAIASRFPRLDFRLLALTLRGEAAPPPARDPRTLIISLDRQQPAGEWAVSDRDWDGLLDQIAYAPTVAQAEREPLYWSYLDRLPGYEQAPPPMAAQISAQEERLAVAEALKAALTASAERNVSAAGVTLARDTLRRTDLAPSIRQLAGQLLAAAGAREEALQALTLVQSEAPGLPRIAVEIAAIHQAMGDLPAARRWCWRALADEPLRPGPYRRLGSMAMDARELGPAVALLRNAVRLGGGETAHDALNQALWLSGDRDGLRNGFAAKCREQPASAVKFAQFLTGEAEYPEVLTLIEGAAANVGGINGRTLSMLAGHARLALRADRAWEVEQALDREGGPRWLSSQALLAEARAAMQAQRPFSLLRLGDGEARFLIHMLEHLRPGLQVEEANAIGDVIWSNWFGSAIGDVDAALKVRLLDEFTASVREADVLGVADAVRLRTDTGHFGYLAAQERWVRELPGPGEHRRFTDAFAHYHLDRLSPFLGELLDGLDFLGVISPHPDLASRLQHRFRIGGVTSHNLPGEGRLATHAAARAREPTLPDSHVRILSELSPPRPGALYLVAGGLLGKIYCGRIRRLGGVALDIGSIADGWMGFNTRPGQLDGAPVLEPV